MSEKIIVGLASDGCIGPRKLWSTLFTGFPLLSISASNSKHQSNLVMLHYIQELLQLQQIEDNKYHFKTVEAIDGGGGFGRVKEAVKDSVSKIVYQSLMDNAMLF